LVTNWIDNLFPNRNLDPKLEVRKFVLDDLSTALSQVPKSVPPDTVLAHLFFMTLPWKQIRDELGEINVLDIGCGSGKWFEKLLTWSDNGIDSYTGIDIMESDSWLQLQERYKSVIFYKTDGRGISDKIMRNRNLIMSRSCLEHVDEDLTYFECIRNYIELTGQNTLQIHVVPSAAGNLLFLTHGVRQYTPRKISMITRLFNPFSYSVLYLLGGDSCNRLHFNKITRPVIFWKPFPRRLRKRDLPPCFSLDFPNMADYYRELEDAIRLDMEDDIKIPNFYALVIHSNAKNRIFAGSS